jgi:hypothetical protein
MPPRALLHFDSWNGKTESYGHTLADLVESPEIWRDLLTDAAPRNTGPQDNEHQAEGAGVPLSTSKTQGE